MNTYIIRITYFKNKKENLQIIDKIEACSANEAILNSSAIWAGNPKIEVLEPVLT